jgi:hypothetical protein
MDANKDWPDTAEDGKAFVVLWADGRGVARFPSKAAVRAWAKKTGAWADITWIRYQEPEHKGKKLREGMLVEGVVVTGDMEGLRQGFDAMYQAMHNGEHMPDGRPWDRIRKEEDPDGTKHDLRLVCPGCGATETCRCSKPKRVFHSPCPDCWVKAEGTTTEAVSKRRGAKAGEEPCWVEASESIRETPSGAGLQEAKGRAAMPNDLEGAWPMTTGPLSQWQKDVIAKATRVGAVRLFRENHEWIITRSTVKARRKWWRMTAYENGKPWGHREYPDLETMLRHFKHTDATLAGGPLEATTSGSVGGFAGAVLGEPAPRRLRRRARRHVPARTRVHESAEWKDLRWAWIDPAGKVYRLTGPAQHAAFAEERGDDENGLESKGWLKLTNFDWLPGLMALATRRRRLTHAQQRVVLDWHVDNDRHIPRWVTIAVED